MEKNFPKISPKPLFCLQSLTKWRCIRRRFVQFPGSYISQSSKNTAVYWGHSSVLEAELLCLQDLLHNNKPWQYAIDLTGSEVEVQLLVVSF